MAKPRDAPFVPEASGYRLAKHDADVFHRVVRVNG